MELICGQHNLRPRHHGCVLTIGNFDGVHRGHQALINQLKTLANSMQLPALAMIFEPQPQEFFAPAKAPARLTALREKLGALRATGLDRVLLLRFNRALANIPPEQFIADLLVARLGVKALVVGEDFRFGRHASGNLALLQSQGERYGFQTLPSVTHQLHGRRVSSSWVREALAQGELALVEQLLGRPYCIQGRVVAGDRLGRTLGFPTANIPLRRVVTALNGVYAMRVRGLAQAPLEAVGYVGTRPTVAGSEPRLEVHVFDFQADIYGQCVEVEFAERLRSDRYFASLDELKTQIVRDATQARAWFARRSEA